LVRSLISKQNKCETAKKKPNMKLISEDVWRSISSIAVMNMQTQETCGKKVTKPRHIINRLILPDIRKISFFRQDVINFRTLLRVKYVRTIFSLMCFRANLDSDMSILSINFDTTGFCSPVFSLHLFLSLTSEIIGGLSMSSLSCSKKDE
jgi:hypothetical protein